MPNRVGEYLGRMIYLPEGSRLRTVSVTLVGSLAQLLVTMFAGTIGLFLLRHQIASVTPSLAPWQAWIVTGALVLFILMLACYLNVSLLVRLFESRFRIRRYQYLVEALEHFETKLLWKLLYLSCIRYCIFMLQYLLLFHFFSVNVSVDTMILVMAVVFWVMAIIPTIALVEVWLRGEVIILLMGIFSTNTLGIGFTSVSVWFLNLILPAIAGSVLILSHRIFRKRTRDTVTGSQA
jgi:hypothetical protein